MPQRQTAPTRSAEKVCEHQWQIRWDVDQHGGGVEGPRWVTSIFSYLFPVSLEQRPATFFCQRAEVSYFLEPAPWVCALAGNQTGDLSLLGRRSTTEPHWPGQTSLSLPVPGHCSNYTAVPFCGYVCVPIKLYMDTEVWISCNFHIVKHVFFWFFFNHIKM